VKPNGWYRTFLEEPHGTIQVADCKIEVRARCIKSERLRDAIDRAYLETYNTAGAPKVCQGARPSEIHTFSMTWLTHRE
jgi:hypothetical protein